MTPIFFAHESRQDLITIINKELQLLDEWFRVNRQSLNIDKTNFIVFHTSRKTIRQMQNEININGVNIKQVVISKFLGVILDEHLTWAPHIKVTASKIAKNELDIRKCIGPLDVSIFHKTSSLSASSIRQPQGLPLKIKISSLHSLLP